MHIEELYKALEGNQGKQAYITLSDDSTITPIIYGTQANDYGDIFLVISDEKHQKTIPSSTIKDIQFPH